MPTNLKQYMGQHYQHINKDLRDGVLKFDGAAQTAAQSKLLASVTTIDRELNEQGKLLKEVTFLGRRGGPLNEYEQLIERAKTEKGVVFSTPAYMSTSSNRSYWTPNKDDSRQVILAIIAHPGGAGRDVSALRNNTSENEVLFHRDARFLVIDCEHLENENVRLYLRELPPGTAAPVEAAAAAMAANQLASGPSVIPAAAIVPASNGPSAAPG